LQGYLLQLKAFKKFGCFEDSDLSKLLVQLHLGKINTTEKKLTDLWESLNENDDYETNVDDYDIVNIEKLNWE